VAGQLQQLDRLGQRLRHAVRLRLANDGARLQSRGVALRRAGPQRLALQEQRLERAGVRLVALDPRQVLQRGYALLMKDDGTVVSHVADARPGEALQAQLADGRLDLTVTRPGLI